MAKIRHNSINSHLINDPNFDDALSTLVQLYNSSPDGSRIRFVQAVEDLFKANSVARGRTAAGGVAGGNSWRDEQKALYSGRGRKWKSIEAGSAAMTALENRITAFEAEGIDCADYRAHTALAGYAWVRYSGPRGDAANQQHGFEVRTVDSRIDHPKQILCLTDLEAADLETLANTPFALGLERQQETKPSAPTETQSEVETQNDELEPTVEAQDETPTLEAETEIELQPETENADELQQLIAEQLADDNDEEDLFEDLEV